MQIGNIKLKNNVFLAPMAGITDMPFRLLCKKFGAGLTYTEMASAIGLQHDSIKTQNLIELNPLEKPAAVQIFGSDPIIMAKTTEYLCEQGADIIDINMGCPAPKITKGIQGSALMLEPELATKIIKEVVKASTVPITVKMRKSYDHNGNGIDALTLSKIAEQNGISAVTIHGRTRSDFYSGTSDIEIIKKVKQAISIPVIGNGDITTPKKAKEILEYTNCDAIMIGRASQGNPWIFKRILTYLENGTLLPEPTQNEKIDMAINHLQKSVEYKGEQKAIKEMRKHLAWYLKGIPNTSKAKIQINKLENMTEVIDILSTFHI